jgi:hypothetical protein
MLERERSNRAVSVALACCSRANVANSATIAVAPGLSAGIMAITGDLTLAATSELHIKLGGAHQGTDYDLLSEAGTAPLNLSGALSVTLAGGFMPTAGDSFVIVNSNQPLTGMFFNVVGGHVTATDGITSLKLSIIGNHVVLGGVLGDYNHNGIVDAADYTVWRDHLGQGVTLPNDTMPGSVTQADYDVWKSNFGNHSGSGSGTSAAVQEPASLLLLLSGILAIYTRRCQKVRKLINV